MIEFVRDESGTNGVIIGPEGAASIARPEATERFDRWATEQAEIMALPPGYLAILAAAEKMSIKLTRDEAYFLERVMKDNGWVIVANWQVDESKRHPGFPSDAEYVDNLVADEELADDRVREGGPWEE